MFIYTIITIATTFGLAFSGPIQNDGVKSAPAHFKGQDLSIKHAFDDPTGESKVSHQASPIQSPTVWQSQPANVVPTIDNVPDGQYVPIIDVKPQTNWYYHRQNDIKKQQFAPADLVIEQRKEEPIIISNYEPVSGVSSVNSDVYDPYRDIMPPVLTGKRRLSDDDAAATSGLVVGQSEGGFVSNGGQKVPVNTVEDTSSGKVAVKSVIYGDHNNNLPQHVYTEDSFPSVITVKGRQYVIIPQQAGHKISPQYGPTQYPWPWAFTGQPGIHHGSAPFDSSSFVYHHHSGPSKGPSYGPGVAVGHGHSQVYGHGHGGLVQHGGYNVPVNQVQTSVYKGWTLPQQQPVSVVHGGGSVHSSSSVNRFDKHSSVHPDYAPYVHTQYVHRMPAYVRRPPVVAYPHQSPSYHGFPNHVTISQVPKVQVSPSYSTKQNWAWSMAPQYDGSEVVNGENWPANGVQPFKGVADAPVVVSNVAPVQADVQQDTKQVFKGVTVETDKRKVQSSPDVKQAAGKSWLVYSPSDAPISSPWIYGWSQSQPWIHSSWSSGQPSWTLAQTSWNQERPWFSPTINSVPQYTAQWAPQGGQWSSTVDQPQWPVKAANSPEAAVNTLTGVGVVDNQNKVQAPVVVQQQSAAATDKVQTVQSSPSGPVSSQVSQQNVAVGGSAGISYALTIDHGDGGKYSFQQSTKSQEAEKKS